MKRTSKGRRFQPETLTPDEVQRLLASFSSGAEGIRNRALVAVLYRTGLRINEALTLYPKDLDLERGAIRVLNGKGGKSRMVGVDPGATAMLKSWLDARASLGLNGTHSVYCVRHGQPIRTEYIRVMLPRFARRAGIEKRVHAHGLRHTHAAELRAEGMDIGLISKQLGHSSTATTARYLDHVAPWAVIDGIGRRRW